MLRIYQRLSQNQLQEALDACKKANKIGYSDAQIYLKGLKKSIDDATEIISDCIDNMRKYRINDGNLIQSIKVQLKSVQTEFEETYFNTKVSLEEKSKMSSKFNITLFGRTKTGKSTLMEILTHGDGSHIGNGGQRTTRDVRSYEWNGMSVTDVPGIDAYGGEEDDKKAEEAAVYADLILFMITAGQPEGTEADWMIKLKKMDKPIVCICNYKQSIGEGIDDFRLKRLLDNPHKLEERMNISELVEQFNTFLHEQLPNEHVDFIVTHLLAKFASQQKEYETISTELDRISRFSNVEQSLISEVFHNGVLHRKKCYLSIIDAPLYQQMNQLFAFSANAYSQFRIIQDKASQFEDWCEKFNLDQKNDIKNLVTQEYNTLRNSIPEFVEKHLEDDDVSKSWNTHCARFPIQNNIEKSVKHIQEKFEEKVSDIFSELKTEMDFSFSWQSKQNLGNYSFIDWKRTIKWCGVISSAGVGIVAFLLSSNPLGWVALGISALFTVAAYFIDSREDKLKERRIKLTEKLNKEISVAEEKGKNKILKWFDENILPQESAVTNRIKIVGRSLLSLSNGERQLALGYAQNHKDITRMMLANMFNSLGVNMTGFDRIVCVARVPGRRIAIVIKGIEDLPLKISELSMKLGNREHINIIKLKTNKEKEAQIYYLLKYFDINIKPLIKNVNSGKQTIVYLYNHNYNQEQLDSINLIQQIMNVHIILKSRI